jgi:hypothetical protein
MKKNYTPKKYPRKVTSHVTARKYEGDDEYSWAVFIDGRPRVTGLNRSIVPHYRKQAHEIVAKKMGISL